MSREIIPSTLPFLLRAALAYSLSAACWFCIGNASGLMASNQKPNLQFVVGFEIFSLVFYFLILRKISFSEHEKTSLLRSLKLGGILSILSAAFIPLAILFGMAIMLLFQIRQAEVLQALSFGPTQPVVFTLLICLISGIFSTILSAGLLQLQSRKEADHAKCFDIFFSFSKMNLGEGMPGDGLLYDNLLLQIQKADQLGFKRAWIGEAHFSIRTEQTKPEPLLPHFNGELCINTDILQIAAVSQSETHKIEIGSAIRNILVNGGPIAHAESIRSFLTLHQNSLKKSGRKIQIGFGVGRFAYANEVYGIKPRNEAEKILWPAVRGLVLRQATEIFLRLLRGETLGSSDISTTLLSKNSVRNPEEWQSALRELNLEADTSEITIPPFWEFQAIKLIPEDCDLSCLELTLGSHDPELQVFANKFLPVRVFNLSVTPGEVIEKTHERMAACYHPDGGPWKREYMPRTIMIFTNAEKHLSTEQQDEKAKEEAKSAMIAYWKAMEGTVDQAKVEGGMENAVYGSPAKVKRMLEEKFHPEDRLMTWFDFNTNDARVVMKRMEDFMTQVKPLFNA